MARKRYSDEDILKLLREIEVNLSTAVTCIGLSGVGISDATITTGASGSAGWVVSLVGDASLEKRIRIGEDRRELELDKLILRRTS